MVVPPALGVIPASGLVGVELAAVAHSGRTTESIVEGRVYDLVYVFTALRRIAGGLIVVVSEALRSASGEKAVSLSAVVIPPTIRNSLAI